MQSPSLHVVHALQHCALKVMRIGPARMNLHPAKTARSGSSQKIESNLTADNIQTHSVLVASCNCKGLSLSLQEVLDQLLGLRTTTHIVLQGSRQTQSTCVDIQYLECGDRNRACTVIATCTMASTSFAVSADVIASTTPSTTTSSQPSAPHRRCFSHCLSFAIGSDCRR